MVVRTVGQAPSPPALHHPTVPVLVIPSTDLAAAAAVVVAAIRFRWQLLPLRCVAMVGATHPAILSIIIEIKTVVLRIPPMGTIIIYCMVWEVSI